MTTDQPPIAKRVPTERTHHGDTVIDEYAWLAAKDDPETVAHLEAENAHTAAVTAHLAGLRSRIFDEIKARTRETDLSVPVRKDRYWYYARTEEGRQYPIHCRRAVADGEVDPPATGDGSPLPGEEVLLDGNLLAADAEFFALGTLDVSPDGRLLAYSTDFSGDERFTLRVRDLGAGSTLADEITDVHYGSAWSVDGSTLFYLTIDEAWRPYRVWRHTIGTPAGDDVMVYEETDERFWVGVELTRSEGYVLIDTSSKITSEVYAIPATAPATPPRLVAERRQGVEYAVEHHAAPHGTDGAGQFLILHNDDAEDFALAVTPAGEPGAWTPVIAHQPGTRLIGVDAFADHLVVSLRRDGLTGLRVISIGATGLAAIADGCDFRDIEFPEPLYTVGPDYNPEFATSSFRLGYTSMVTPDSVYDCDLATGAPPSTP